MISLNELKLEELRIGNYFTIEGKVLHLDRRLLYAIVSGMPEYQDIYSIPLTKEWLERMGFEKKPQTKWHGNGQDYEPEHSWSEEDDYVFEMADGFKFIIRYGRDYFHNELDNCSTRMLICSDWYPKVQEGEVWVRLDYVHQLQNLYFALIGEELSI